MRVTSVLALLLILAVHDAARPTALAADPPHSPGRSEVPDADGVRSLAAALLPIPDEALTTEQRQAAVRTLRAIGPLPRLWGEWIDTDGTIKFIDAMLTLSDDQRLSLSRSLRVHFDRIHEDLIRANRVDLEAALAALQSVRRSNTRSPARINAAGRIAAAAEEISRRLASGSRRIEEVILQTAPMLTRRQAALLPLVASATKQEVLLASLPYRFPGLHASPLSSALGAAGLGWEDRDLAMLGIIHEVARPTIESRETATLAFATEHARAAAVVTRAETAMTASSGLIDARLRSSYEHARRRLAEAARRVSETNLDLCIDLAALEGDLRLAAGVALWARASVDLSNIVETRWLESIAAADHLKSAGIIPARVYAEFRSFVRRGESALKQLVSAYLDEVEYFLGTGLYDGERRIAVGPKMGTLRADFDRACRDALHTLDHHLRTLPEAPTDVDAVDLIRDASAYFETIVRARTDDGFYERSPWVTQVPR